MRVWDQRAEVGFGKSIEDAFQHIAGQIAEGTITHVPEGVHGTITEMYLLWRHRCIRARAPLPDVPLNIVRPTRDLTSDQQEVLESRGFSFVQPDGAMPGRMAAGALLQVGMDRDWAAGASGMRWGILRSPPGAEFLVPDAFIGQPLLPVAPDCYLASGAASGVLSLGETGAINREAKLASSSYWFCRDVRRCPL
jgi:hypothetical protein